MKGSVLRVFVREVECQCVIGTRALDDLHEAIGRHDFVWVWSCVQTLLTAAANVSKLLWPAKSGDADRGAALRTILGVSVDSPLASRTLRNHVEHFDERLDAWARSGSDDSEGLSLVVRLVGAGPLPVGPLPVEGFAPEDYFLYLDVFDLRLIFAGDTCELRPLVEAMRELEEKAAAFLFGDPVEGAADRQDTAGDETGQSTCCGDDRLS